MGKRQARSGRECEFYFKGTEKPSEGFNGRSNVILF